MSTFLTIPHCFDYHSFVVRFEISKCETFNSALFKDCFGYSGTLEIHLNFRMDFSISAKNVIVILIEMALYLLVVWTS